MAKVKKTNPVVTIEKKKAGRPRTRTGEPEKSAQKGLKQGEERFNVVSTGEIIEAIKNIAYWNRALVKDVTGAAFAEYIERFIVEHPEHVQDGIIKPRA